MTVSNHIGASFRFRFRDVPACCWFGLRMLVDATRACSSSPEESESGATSGRSRVAAGSWPVEHDADTDAAEALVPIISSIFS